jgi:phosphatidate cytidylyltransferase
VAAAAFYRLVRPPAAGRSLEPRTALARALSYGVLAAALALSVALGGPGIAVLVLLIGLAGLLEWAAVLELPIHHRVVMVGADIVLVAAIYAQGAAATPWLVGGLVLVGALWPVIRADTERAVRDLGLAAIGFVFVAVTLAHAVAINHERPLAGPVLLAALAVGCAGSDVGAFLVGRRFGTRRLAPSLSPNKMRAGLIGNVVGAAVGLLPLAPALSLALPADGIPVWFAVVLVPIVAVGAVWGDLFKSAAKREAGVKDFGDWLPGFGGILDRVDSLLMTLPLAYWGLRVLELAGAAT